VASLVTDPARAPGAAVLTHLTATARATLHSARRCLRALVTVSIGPTRNSLSGERGPHVRPQQGRPCDRHGLESLEDGALHIQEEIP
jgi:hypothetical protein